MQPAYRTRLGLIVRAVFFASVLTSPIWMHRLGMLDEHKIYTEVTVDNGPFKFISDELDEKKGPIDVVFVGSSGMWNCYDLGLLQKILSEKMGHPITTISLTANWRYDHQDVMMLRALTEKRKVRFVFYEPNDETATEAIDHLSGRYWWDDWKHLDDTRGLRFKDRVALYGQTMMGSLRHVLSSIRPNERLGLAPWGKVVQEGYEAARGGARISKGWKKYGGNKDRLAFVSRAYDPPPIRTSDVFFDGKDTPTLQFTGTPFLPEQVYFMKRIKYYADKANAPLYLLQIPSPSATEKTVRLRTYDKADFGGKVIPTIAVPGALAFAGMKESEVHDLFFNDRHCNANGIEYVTEQIAPVILEVIRGKR